jgi:hypothetical protein
MLISSPPQAILNSYGVAPEAFGYRNGQADGETRNAGCRGGSDHKEAGDDIQRS